MDSASQGVSNDGRTVQSAKTGQKPDVASPTKVASDDESEDEGHGRDTTKRKADTDARNP